MGHRFELAPTPPESVYGRTMWMVRLCVEEIDRYLGRDAYGWHTCSREKATQFDSEPEAQAAKDSALKEFPKAKFEVVPC